MGVNKMTKEAKLKRVADHLNQTASLYGYKLEKTQRFKKNGDAVVEIVLHGIEDDEEQK